MFTATDEKAARAGTQCPPPGGFFYLISHNKESQHQTPEEFGVLLQAGEKRVAQVLELLSLFFVHLVRAERRFFPQHGAFPVEGCRILAAELCNARRQRMDRRAAALYAHIAEQLPAVSENRADTLCRGRIVKSGQPLPQLAPLFQITCQQEEAEKVHESKRAET